MEEAAEEGIEEAADEDMDGDADEDGEEDMDGSFDEEAEEDTEKTPLMIGMEEEEAAEREARFLQEALEELESSGLMRRSGRRDTD